MRDEEKLAAMEEGQRGWEEKGLGRRGWVSGGWGRNSNVGEIGEGSWEKASPVNVRALILPSLAWVALNPPKKQKIPAERIMEMN